MVPMVTIIKQISINEIISSNGISEIVFSKYIY